MSSRRLPSGCCGPSRVRSACGWPATPTPTCTSRWLPGIIYLALGLKKVAQYVSDGDHHTLADPLTGTPLCALYGGVAAYLLAHLAFRERNVGWINRPRAVAVAVLLLAPLAVGQLPALAALGVLAAVLVVLICFEVVHYAEARAAVRVEEGPG